jgi:hypothetical protein
MAAARIVVRIMCVPLVNYDKNQESSVSVFTLNGHGQAILAAPPLSKKQATGDIYLGIKLLQMRKRRRECRV